MKTNHLLTSIVISARHSVNAAHLHLLVGLKRGYEPPTTCFNDAAIVAIDAHDWTPTYYAPLIAGSSLKVLTFPRGHLIYQRRR